MNSTPYDVGIHSLIPCKNYILTKKDGERPDIDSNVCELTRDGDGCLLRTQNKDVSLVFSISILLMILTIVTQDDEVTYEGIVSSSSGNMEGILVYNEKLGTFELRKITTQLRTTDVVKVKPKRLDKPPPKRRKAEPSIFAPKARLMSPMSVSGGVKRPNSTPVLTTPLSDDEVPLAKTSPMRPSSTKPNAPSPLAVTSTSPNFKPTSSQPTSSQPKSKTTTPLLQEDRSSISPPAVEQVLKQPVPSKVASKKPPSTIMTPTITEDEPASNEEDFEALVDELEDELLSEDGLIVEENSSNNRTLTPSRSAATNFEFDYNGKRPMSFRDLAGMGNNDEDDITSSSEEE
jgi:hypothetical protein